uniref:hypothetical protein n=1 Tax=Dickeya oryzae TaxID=1240404 RepID=UPI0029500103
RKVTLTQKISSADQQPMMDRIFQLTNVPWPAVFAELALRFGVYGHRPIAQAGAIFFNEMACQRQDIARSFLQSGHRKRHDIQSIEKVFPE